jgi:mono/diheme cytochrome c family protein
VGDIAAGLTKYTTYCAGCHTSNVKANVLSVTKATTVAALDAAIAKVGSMGSLANTLTMQDKLDITAYITSAR